jgi:hypothetical protein
MGDFMLKAQLKDGSTLLVDPEKLQEFEAQFGHLLQSVPGSLSRGLTDKELVDLKALLADTDATQSIA